MPRAQHSPCHAAPHSGIQTLLGGNMSEIDLYKTRMNQISAMLKQEIKDYMQAAERRDISSLELLHGWIKEHVRDLKAIESYLEDIEEV